MFDHKEGATYEQTTAPLREMLVKGAIFSWNKRREDAFQTLMRMMSSEATLRPFTPGLPTQFVSDACPWGIAASVYQVREDKTWVPVDHISRADVLTSQRMALFTANFSFLQRTQRILKILNRKFVSPSSDKTGCQAGLILGECCCS